MQVKASIWLIIVKYCETKEATVKNCKKRIRTLKLYLNSFRIYQINKELMMPAATGKLPTIVISESEQPQGSMMNTIEILSPFKHPQYILQEKNKIIKLPFFIKAKNYSLKGTKISDLPSDEGISFGQDFIMNRPGTKQATPIMASTSYKWKVRSFPFW